MYDDVDGDKKSSGSQFKKNIFQQFGDFIEKKQQNKIEKTGIKEKLIQNKDIGDKGILEKYIDKLENNTLTNEDFNIYVEIEVEKNDSKIEEELKNKPELIFKFKNFEDFDGIFKNTVNKEFILDNINQKCSFGVKDGWSITQFSSETGIKYKTVLKKWLENCYTCNLNIVDNLKLNEKIDTVFKIKQENPELIKLSTFELILSLDVNFDKDIKGNNNLISFIDSNTTYPQRMYLSKFLGYELST